MSLNLEEWLNEKLEENPNFIFDYEDIYNLLKESGYEGSIDMIKEYLEKSTETLSEEELGNISGGTQSKNFSKKVLAILSLFALINNNMPNSKALIKFDSPISETSRTKIVEKIDLLKQILLTPKGVAGIACGVSVLSTAFLGVLSAVLIPASIKLNDNKKLELLKGILEQCYELGKNKTGEEKMDENNLNSIKTIFSQSQYKNKLKSEIAFLQKKDLKLKDFIKCLICITNKLNFWNLKNKNVIDDSIKSSLKQINLDSDVNYKDMMNVVQKVCNLLYNLPEYTVNDIEDNHETIKNSNSTEEESTNQKSDDIQTTIVNQTRSTDELLGKIEELIKKASSELDNRNYKALKETWSNIGISMVEFMELLREQDESYDSSSLLNLFTKHNGHMRKIDSLEENSKKKEEIKEKVEEENEKISNIYSKQANINEEISDLSFGILELKIKKDELEERVNDLKSEKDFLEYKIRSREDSIKESKEINEKYRNECLSPSYNRYFRLQKEFAEADKKYQNSCENYRKLYEEYKKDTSNQELSEKLRKMNDENEEEKLKLDIDKGKVYESMKEYSDANQRYLSYCNDVKISEENIINFKEKIKSLEENIKQANELYTNKVRELQNKEMDLKSKNESLLKLKNKPLNKSNHTRQKSSLINSYIVLNTDDLKEWLGSLMSELSKIAELSKNP